MESIVTMAGISTRIHGTISGLKEIKSSINPSSLPRNLVKGPLVNMPLPWNNALWLIGCSNRATGCCVSILSCFLQEGPMVTMRIFYGITTSAQGSKPFWCHPQTGCCVNILSSFLPEGPLITMRVFWMWWTHGQTGWTKKLLQVYDRFS